MVAVALIAIITHFVAKRAHAERRRQLQALAKQAAEMHRAEVRRMDDLISSERTNARALPSGIDLLKKLGRESAARGSPQYIASLRDILPWQERWLDFHRRATSYYKEIEGGGSPSPERTMELAQAQAKLLKERRDLAARHRGVAGLMILNWMRGPMSSMMSGLGPKPPLYIPVPDPFDIRDAPDFTRPTHTFKEAGAMN